MTRFDATGAAAPAWIRDRILAQKAAWPPLVLAAFTALLVLATCVMEVILWTSEPAVYYAHP